MIVLEEFYYCWFELMRHKQNLHYEAQLGTVSGLTKHQPWLLSIEWFWAATQRQVLRPFGARRWEFQQSMWILCQIKPPALRSFFPKENRHILTKQRCAGSGTKDSTTGGKPQTFNQLDFVCLVSTYQLWLDRYLVLEMTPLVRSQQIHIADYYGDCWIQDKQAFSQYRFVQGFP